MMLSTLVVLALTSQCPGGNCAIHETPLDFRDHTVVIPAPRWFAPVPVAHTYYPGAATVAVGGYGMPDLRYRADFPRVRVYARPRLFRPLLRPFAPLPPPRQPVPGRIRGRMLPVSHPMGISAPADLLREIADALEDKAASWQQPWWRIDLNETSHRVAALRAAARQIENQPSSPEHKP